MRANRDPTNFPNTPPEHTTEKPYNFLQHHKLCRCMRRIVAANRMRRAFLVCSVGAALVGCGVGGRSSVAIPATPSSTPSLAPTSSPRTSPTPSQSPSPTVSPTATMTPSPRPTHGPSSSPSPTSPPWATPSPTPTLSPTPVPNGIALSPSSVELNNVGQTITLTATPASGHYYQVKSSDVSVAAVTLSGSTITVTAISAGFATITLADETQESATTQVTVSLVNIVIQ